MGESYVDNVTDELSEENPNVLDVLRREMDSLYDAVDALCEANNLPKPSRF